jgi:hypothetical protein
MGEDSSIRRDLLVRQLRDLLRSPHAHVSLADAVAGVPPELRGARAPGQSHTLWRLLEHLRLAQWDIAEFSRSSAHVSPAFPDGYWPDGDAPPDEGAWERTLQALRDDLAGFEAMLRIPPASSPSRSPGATGRPFCARRCSSPTTTRTTSARS